jgi:FkbM family methyltransferase
MTGSTVHVVKPGTSRNRCRLASIPVLQLRANSGLEKRAFGPLGEIVFPYFQMGARDSLNLFELDEVIIFSFYWANRGRYKKVLDIGANIGLHSLVLAKCGYQVEAFEPDPIHWKQLEYVLQMNQVDSVRLHRGAVSSKSGQAEFVRVLGNTTANHLSGSKSSYGELQKFSVELFDIHQLLSRADLIKMDVEGHEGEIILSTKGTDWEHTDAILEVGSFENAKLIYDHLNAEEVYLFSQKNNWQRVSALQDMPISHREGSLFISKKPTMFWL